jgi:CheY-like chemotaxis protein
MVTDPHACVLIVEDDEPIRATMRMLIEGENFEVLEAENGREALNCLRESKHPNLILLDMMMPVMNGFEFEAAIDGVPDCGDIPVVAVTAFPEKAKNLKHICAVLQKPFDIEQLLKVVRRYCGTS